LDDIKGSDRSLDPIPHRRGGFELARLDLVQEHAQVACQCSNFGVSQMFRHWYMFPPIVTA
jgi:hypothetical protein